MSLFESFLVVCDKFCHHLKQWPKRFFLYVSLEFHQTVEEAFNFWLLTRMAMRSNADMEIQACLSVYTAKNHLL